jgi:uncharacterized membrane protein
MRHGAKTGYREAARSFAAGWRCAMTHIHDSIMINAPVDRVYALGRDPRRWATWWVNLSEPRKIKGDGSEGSVVEHDYLVAGLQLHLKTKVLDDRYDVDGSGHWRGSFDGSMHGEQRWDYTPREGGTEVSADIDYTVPGGLLGKVADRVLLERMEERAIHQTLENLKFLVEH